MAGWLYIIYEIFAGEASQISAAMAQRQPDGVQCVTPDRDRWLGNLSNRLHPGAGRWRCRPQPDLQLGGLC